MAEGDFPGWADMLSPLSNCSLVHVPEWELAPSPLSHCLFPQSSSHGAHGFSSPSRSPALSHWLCLALRISASSALPSPSYSFSFPFFSYHLTVFPYIIFCMEVQKAVGLHCGDTKVGSLLRRLASISFTLLSVLLGCRGPGCACLVGMRGPRAQLDNGSTVPEKAALSGCHCGPHPLSTGEGKGVPPCPCMPLTGQN